MKPSEEIADKYEREFATQFRLLLHQPTQWKKVAESLTAKMLKDIVAMESAR